MEERLAATLHLVELSNTLDIYKYIQLHKVYY